MKSIDVSDLPEPLAEAIEALVRTYRQRAEPDQPRRPREMGWYKGEWELPPAFFEPLPDDLLDLFEGHGGPDPLQKP